METLQAIKTRRSVRHYKPDPVSDDVLQQLLEAVQRAPSWANTQCWRFIVVRDAATREALSGCTRTAASRGLAEAPLAVVACAEMGRSGFYHGEASTDKNEWFMYDLGIAMEHLALAAHALGLGTVHVGLFDNKKAAKILGVPEGFCVVAMTPLGYPADEGKLTQRKPLEEIIFEDKFGASRVQ